MSALHMDRLPTGTHHWRTLVEELLAVGDDRHEGHHLELKSEVDLSTKTGRAKIAKFILATANRSPDFAAPRFGGHAVMLVGLDYSSTPPAIGGAGRFDDKDLRREVTNFVGDPGPAWDYQRIDIDGSEVVAIIVDPPKQAAIWPCQRDGENVRNGLIYLRPGAESRPANGPEVTAMLNRVRHAQPAVEVDVQILGSVWAVGFDPSAAIAQFTMRSVICGPPARAHRRPPRPAGPELASRPAHCRVWRCPGWPAETTRGVGTNFKLRSTTTRQRR
ncbi:MULTISPECIES: ATP-binding protein [Nocardiaceae]|uniref:ATP-binding protein n=1 Tax=Nocardiaceae TaxID=85025 RepID=UPI0034E9458F